eukprot:Seg1278.10 transcript_id=Seg1278.10/GoldUCD/mRNA.D3Y31 product="Ras guanine nucleotide exchange factor F" protein_id=Seg1278.10/GoldUCD/D3Y31
MEIEPLLAHREDDSFKLEFMELQEHHKPSRTHYQGVELLDMGQSLTRNNKIQTFGEQDWTLSNSVIKLNMQEILELKSVFKRLARLSPEDQCISKQTFLHYFPLEGALGERLFGIFDKDKDEKINAGEFLSGISLCLRGSMADKCRLLFHMFDLDGDEGVSEDELYKMLKPTLKAADSLSLKNNRSSNKFSEEKEDFSDVARLLVNEAFEECDLNQTGMLSMQNFQGWLGGHRELVKAVFNYPFQSLMKKSEKYGELKADDARNTRLYPQTWMDEFSENGNSKDTKLATSLVNAKYLWSPLFPQSSSKFPPSRSKHAAVLYHGHIYIFGGRGRTSTLKDLWRYSLVENAWDLTKGQSGSIPPALQEQTAVVYKNDAYIFGGAFATDQRTPFWSYEFESLTWKDLSRRKFQKEPLNRRAHTAVVYRDSMFIFGGYLDTGSATNELWRYCFTTLRWYLLTPKEGTEVITARHSHSAVVHSNAIWIFGGFENRGRKNDLWKWDFELFTWTRIRTKGGPSLVAGHTASKIGSLMIFFGGEGNTELKNETWTFNFDTIQWTKITPLSSITPTLRSHHTAVVLNPYSAHCGPLPISRPTTTKSAPDTRDNRLRRNSPGFNPFPRVASADSILDYPTKRMIKGKSLDLSFELDNGGYDKSFPDVSHGQSDEILNTDLQMSSDRNVINVLPYDETSLQLEMPTVVHDNWAIFIIGGKGKQSTDMYKTSVDIWRCDIGQDVGSHYQIKPITRKEQQVDTRPRRTQTAKSREKLSYDLFDNEFENKGQREQIHAKGAKDRDNLIITDLTVDETENTFSTLENKHLLR